MKSNWLITSSLDFSMGALSAINILSIDYKLKAKQIDNPIPQEKVEQSREKLLAFLQEVQVIATQHETEPDAPVLGKEPHVEQLVVEIINHQNDQSINDIPIEELIQLLTDNDSSNFTLIIEYLDNLSTLVEQQASSDFDWVWGNV